MKKILLIAVSLFVFQFLAAQENVPDPKKNIVKINIPDLVIRNYSLQYERVLNKTISLAVAYRFMPEGTTPMKNIILDYVDDQDAIDAINEAQLSNFAVTPEIRFYLGKKGFGRGAYISIFYRYANFDLRNVNYDFENDEEAINASVGFDGNIKSNTVGFVIGHQWSLGRHLCLDLWLLGPHVGLCKTNVNGIPSEPLDQEQQDLVRDKLNDFDSDPYDKTVSVSSNKVSMNLDGPFGGFRAGFSFGIKF